MVVARQEPRQATNVRTFFCYHHLIPSSRHLASPKTQTKQQQQQQQQPSSCAQPHVRADGQLCTPGLPKWLMMAGVPVPVRMCSMYTMCVCGVWCFRPMEPHSCCACIKVRSENATCSSIPLPSWPPAKIQLLTEKGQPQGLAAPSPMPCPPDQVTS